MQTTAQNNYFLLGFTALFVAACHPTNPMDDISPFDGWQPFEETGTFQESTIRITIETDEGPFTFSALSPDGTPLRINAGFAQSDGERELLFLSDGTHRYQFNTDALSAEHPHLWVGPEGQSVEPDTLLEVGTEEGSYILAVREEQLRVYNADSQSFGESTSLVEIVDEGTGATAAFTPVSIIWVDGLGQLFGFPFLALSHERTLVMGDYSAVFSRTLGILNSCGNGDPIEAYLLTVATLQAQTGLIPEDIFAVADQQKWHFDQAGFCFTSLGPLVDANQDPIEPVAGFGVDLDGDGVDSIVWIHP